MDEDNIRVSIDTRTIKPGEYFVPIKGENFDGHSFIEEAKKQGAVGILTEEDLYKLAKKKLLNSLSNEYTNQNRHDDRR